VKVPAFRRRWHQRLLTTSAGVLVVLATAPPGLAEPAGEIDQVQTRGGVVHVLFSLQGIPDGVRPDLSSTQVAIDGEPQAASAELASQAGDTVQRATVLAIDVSDSMAGARFESARAAALAFIDQAPADVRIGLVTFAGEVTRVQEPTDDRGALRAAIRRLTLTPGTLLYQGIEESLDMLAGEASGNVLVLSDGRDTTGAPVSQVLSALRQSNTRIDVVALEQTGSSLEVLRDLAAAGSGQVIKADDASLTDAFRAQAAELESQVVVSFDVPEGWDGGAATLAVTVQAGGVSYTDEALVDVGAAAEAPVGADRAVAPRTLQSAPQPQFGVSRDLMLGGLVALGLGGALIALLFTGVFGGSQGQTLDDRLGPYAGDSRSRTRTRTVSAPSVHGPSVKQQAVGLAEKAMSGGMDVSLARRLDAAGMKLNSAEWLLLHTGVAVGAAGLGFLFSGGRLLPTLLLLLFGAAGPWAYLSLKRSRRLKAFNSQLADTLQLISGSLSAGLSLAQSLDTVVREGNQPVSGEFRRALVEQRLGVEIETALHGVAERMQSDDFAWVVMAIRIQREVGGNLAELLLTVASTLREREYLRRQVSVLSAEGRLSAFILGGLPPLFVVYLAMARPTYLAPMYTTSLGLLMSGSGLLSLVVGVFWLKKAVKVEV